VMSGHVRVDWAFEVEVADAERASAADDHEGHVIHPVKQEILHIAQILALSFLERCANGKNPAIGLYGGTLTGRELWAVAA
jgi:hypothetical protein